MQATVISGGLALALLLAGCMSPGLSAHAQALARQLEASTPVAASEPGDEPFEGQASLERAALIEAALRRNPGLAAARSAWRAALARYPQETALEDPMLDGSIGPDSFGSDAVDPGFRIGLSQALPFPGKRGLRGERALAEAEASSQEYASRATGARRDGFAALRRVLPRGARVRAERPPSRARRGALPGGARALRVRKRVAAGRAARRGRGSRSSCTARSSSKPRSAARPSASTRCSTASPSCRCRRRPRRSPCRPKSSSTPPRSRNGR